MILHISSEIYIALVQHPTLLPSFEGLQYGLQNPYQTIYESLQADFRALFSPFRTPSAFLLYSQS